MLNAKESAQHSNQTGDTLTRRCRADRSETASSTRRIVEATQADLTCLWSMKPQDTHRGQMWLENFAPEDRPVAGELMNSIRFVSQSTIRQSLVSYINSLVDRGSIEHPAMLLPALSIEDLPTIRPSGRPHVVFETYEPNDLISSRPGSEGFVGNIARDIERSGSGPERQWLPPTTTLDQLRDLGCKSLVIITDYSGSGNQLERYAKSLVRNESIRSWRSGGKILVHAVAFSATSNATVLLGRPGSPVDALWSVESAPTVQDRPWTPDLRRNVEDLCHRYALRKRRKQALGYESSGGLFASEFGAPNNLPVILRQRTDRWNGFFDERSVPTDLAAELDDYSPGFVAADLVAATGQVRLARSQPRGFRSSSFELLQVLALQKSRVRPQAELAATLSVDRGRIHELMSALTALDLVDGDGRLTKAGDAEVAAGKRATRLVAQPRASSKNDYYPKGMR